MVNIIIRRMAIKRLSGEHEPMRVCIVTGVFPPQTGGPATYAAQLAEGLEFRGHETSVIAYGSAGLQTLGVWRVDERQPLLVKLASAAWLAFGRAGAADVVLATDPIIAGIPAVLAARLRGKPFVLRLVGNFAWENAVRLGWIASGMNVETFQRTRFGLKVECLRGLQEFIARHADYVIVPSHYTQRLWRTWRIAEERFRIIPNAVAPLSMGTDKQALGLPADRKIVLCVARLLPFKQVHKVIECMAANKIPALLVVIGEGEQENELKRLASRLGVEAWFLGRRPHEKVMQYLSACDAFVLYSTYEGQSHLLLEAMAAGAPIVASDIEPNRELIQEGVNGLLVSLDDPNQLAQKLALVLNDLGLAQRLTAAAKKTAKQHSWSVLVEETLRAFNEVLVGK